MWGGSDCAEVNHRHCNSTPLIRSALVLALREMGVPSYCARAARVARKVWLTRPGAVATLPAARSRVGDGDGELQHVYVVDRSAF